MKALALGRATKAWMAYLLMGVLIIHVYYLVPADGAGKSVRVLLYCLVSVSAAAAVWIGAWRNRPSPRFPWLLLGLSQLVYAGADTAFYVSHYLLGQTTYPSTADVLYLLHYPLVMAALVLLIRHRAPGRDLPGLLDAAILAVASGLLSWVFLIGPQARFDQPTIAKLTSVLYPVMDLALLAVALRMILGGGRRPPAFFLLSGNLLAIMAADTVYVWQQLNGVYQPGNVLDAIWLAGNLCLGAAALHPTMSGLSQPFHARDRGTGPVRMAALSAAALVAPAMLLIEYWRRAFHDIPATALACALLFALTIARLAGLVATQRRLAITDALTGLSTRRFLEAQLSLELARARRNGGHVAVLMADLDHFKSINDRHGHPAGDRALVEVADRLREAIRPGDVLARYGGEEFALLVPGAGPDELTAISERLRHHVAHRPVTVSTGACVVVTVSVGAVSYPCNGESPAELVAAADRALYRAKAGGRDRVAIGDPPPQPMSIAERAPMVEFLRRIADGVDGCLSAYEHSTAVSRWSVTLSRALGHDEGMVARLELAGRLHDIGKIVIPEPVLTKPAALSPEEWVLLRMHPDHGARLARLVPGFGGVAEVIRQHHERFDGAGYPDGLSATAIRPEARIVAVCDSWAAMRCDRPYQRALSEDEAREQLWLGRGTQFDPDVVDVFLALHEQGLVGGPLQLARPDGQESARVFQKLIS